MRDLNIEFSENYQGLNSEPRVGVLHIVDEIGCSKSDVINFTLSLSSVNDRSKIRTSDIVMFLPSHHLVSADKRYKPFRNGMILKNRFGS